jgi:hypothetical protein
MSAMSLERRRMSKLANVQTGNGSVETVGGSQRFSTRAVIIGLAAIGLTLVGGIVLLQLFVVERIPELTEARLELAEQLWNEQGPASYDMDLELRGAQPGNVHIEVRNRVVAATTRNGRTPPAWTWDAWSVPGMFETLAQDLQTAEAPAREIQAPPGTHWWLRCEFDPKFGVPRRYHRQVSGNGPEVFWQVTRFEAL